MAKIEDLDAITSAYEAVTKLNDNFADIEAAFDNTLSRDGSSPNQMEANIDMNHNKLLNVGDGAVNSDGVNLGQVTDLITAQVAAVNANLNADVVGTRLLLAAIAAPVDGQSALLTESGREGLFVFDSSDLSDEVTDDTTQGHFVAPATDTTGASGAWRRKMETFVNVRHFGAIGDGTTDDTPAILAALNTLEPRGGTLYFPKGYYRISSMLEIAQTVTIQGEGWGYNPGRVGTDLFALPYFVHGTVLVFDAGISAITFYPHNRLENPADVAALPVEQRFAEYSATGSSINGIAMVSMSPKATSITATYAPGEFGVLIRAYVTLSDVWVYGFGDYGIWVSADAATVDSGVKFGNANHCRFENVWVWGSGSHGIFIEGRDANNCLFTNVNLSHNGGWGYRDETLTGNVVLGGQFNVNNVNLQASATANIGSASVPGATTATSFICCYGEGAGGYISDLSQAVIVDGGNYGGDLFHPAGSQHGNRFANNATKQAWNGLSDLGDTDVKAGVGRNPGGAATNTPFWFGSKDISSLMNQFNLNYVLANKAWSWNYLNEGQVIMQFPNEGALWRTTSVYGPSFPNGIFLGLNAAGPRIFYGTAVPATGNWRVGDVVWNSAPAVGEPSHWQCVVAGAPGTWAASPNLV